MRTRLAAAGLEAIDEKLRARARLTFDEGVQLFACPDLLAVGWLANRERERRHGQKTFYNYNLRLEPTNVCEANCMFCSFARLKATDPAAYTMTLEQAWDKLRQRANQPLTEIHIVNGLNPHLPFSYYTDLLRGFKQIRPDIQLKCFTAVELAYFADLYGKTDEQVLRELMDAGLDSLPGGGAEIFADRVRKKICHDKCGANRYLAIHRLAHRLGMRTNVTMLYGHIETIEERVDHMLRVLAVSRLMLDNVDHIKAFWVATGVEVAQTALWFGVDDLDGTVQEEKIYHMAGSPVPEGMTTSQLTRLVQAAGRVPLERDTLYRVLSPEAAVAQPATVA